MTHTQKVVLGWMAILLVAIYLVAFALGDLRKNTVAFEYLFFGAFVLYGVACFIVLQSDEVDHRILVGFFVLAAAMQGILIFTRPTLSDDMFRYVWDGRVQAQGISPYRFPPDAPELAHLRDGTIYPSINRPDAVTVYPPAAEAAYVLLWRIWPDNIHWFQAAMAAGGLLAGVLLLGLLVDLGHSPSRVLIFLWSPLLAFETAHGAHIDGLVLPLVVGAWWARVKEHDALTGFLLGIATVIKFYPALLLPFLWRPTHREGVWRMPLAFGSTVVLFYLPYFAWSGGWQVLGYLPNYLQEQFNISPLVSFMNQFLVNLRLYTPSRLTEGALGLIALAALWAIFHPAADAKTALRRCIWPMGIITLFSQDLFSWYLLWFLPLVAIFLETSGYEFGRLRLPRLDAWTGWWLFCGLVGLSYTFFIDWKPVNIAIQAQFLPLYALLLASLFTHPWKKLASSLKLRSI